MKAINLGDNTYSIFSDAMRVYEKLPAQVYVVRFSETRGFFLEKYNDMNIKESRVYGIHEEKVNKVLSMFENQDRNLGVILSGDKGIGKSLFAKMLSSVVIQRGIPTIIVDRYVPGIASYIEDIEQEVMVLFDEFDKTFGEVKSKDGEASPQANLLSLFDGLSSGKKLFVVTCNELRKLNEYLINRPGRFHYHFRFEYPSATEIREYLQDKLDEEYYEEINAVVSFSNKVRLNYDCLRSIATELNTGIPFSEAIKDLNIINTELQMYNIALRFNNGVVFRAQNISMDMFGDDEDKTVYMYDKRGRNVVDITFKPCDAIYDTMKFAHVIIPENLKVEYYFKDGDDKYDYEDDKAMEEAIREAGVECVVINRRDSRGIHYNV
ncbi:AAA family ATPase [Ruminococcus sp. AF12-5]|nr:AAA family ATPase [Ruminococcus sp. AF12-5]